MDVIIDYYLLVYLLIGFLFGGFGVGFILPLLIGGTPTRTFFKAKLLRRPVLMVWRPDRRVIASIPKYVADMWIGKIAGKEKGLFRIHPEAVSDFGGVRLAIADVLDHRIVPPNIYKLLEQARRLGYENVEDLLDYLKKQATDLGFNPEVDYVRVEPPKILFMKAENEKPEVKGEVGFAGEGIRISDLEKMFETTNSSAFLMQLQSKYAYREMLEKQRSLLDYVGLGLMMMFAFVGLMLLLQGLKSMGWIQLIRVLLHVI